MTRASEIAAHLAPPPKESSARTFGVLKCVPKQRTLIVADDRNRAPAQRGLGTVDEPGRQILRDVVTLGTIALAPTCRRRDDERDTRAPIGIELCDQLLQLLFRQRSRAGLVLGRETDRNDRGDRAVPDARPKRQLQRRPK